MAADRTVLLALAANLGQALAKFLAFLATGSSSMLAEAIHSVGDSGNEMLLLIGARRAARAATPEHPFGYGRARFLFGFVVSVVVFSLGGMVSLFEGYRKIASPQPITSWRWVPIAVIVIGMLLEMLTFRTAVKDANMVRGKMSWKNYVRHAKSPDTIVVGLESLAGILGLTIALAGVGLTLITDDGIWDGLGTAAIGVLLVAVSIVLAIEMTSLLIGESATPEQVRSIESAIMAGPETDRIIHMRTLHLGPEELLVAAKIAARQNDDAVDIARGIDRIETRIREAVPIARVIYLEPDIYHGEAPASSDEIVSRIELAWGVEAARAEARAANQRADAALLELGKLNTTLVARDARIQERESELQLLREDLRRIAALAEQTAAAAETAASRPTS